ncbi:MAG: hypothetical protein M1548_09645 [Actinobacteria bacterium]|nr:hypothetical protein [Actinomycetota bacterium]
MGRCPEFSGGGLKRSKTLEEAGPQERWAYDERVLGDGGFVEALLLAEEAKDLNSIFTTLAQLEKLIG